MPVDHAASSERFIDSHQLLKILSTYLSSNDRVPNVGVRAVSLEK